MSHFTVGVVIPQTGDPDEHIAKLFAPYDENIQVPEYEKPYDISWFAQSDKGKARGLTEQSSIPEIFEAYKAQYPEAVGEKDEGVYLRDGVAYYKTTYNPKSKWDWYEIGGRWASDLPGQSDMASLPAVLKWLDNGGGFFAIVTPDGKWHERGKMGWFAMVADEKERDEWVEQQRLILSKCLAEHPDYIVVLVDCHI